MAIAAIERGAVSSVAETETPIGVFDLRRRAEPTARGFETITEALLGGELPGDLAAHPYDLILIDVDHTPRERLDESSSPCYPADGERRVRRRPNAPCGTTPLSGHLPT